MGGKLSGHKIIV